MNEQLMRHPMYTIIDGMIDDLGIKNTQIDHQDIVEESIQVFEKSMNQIADNNKQLGEDQVREIALDDLKTYLSASY